jgi:hypothetical protein
LPSNALTINGNPAASVSSPMVICGSKRRCYAEVAVGRVVFGLVSGSCGGGGRGITLASGGLACVLWWCLLAH